MRKQFLLTLTCLVGVLALGSGLGGGRFLVAPVQASPIQAAAPVAAAPVAGAQDGGFLTDAVPEEFNMVGVTDRNRLTEVRRVRGDYETRVSTALQGNNALSAADQDLVRNWVGLVVMAEMTTLNPEGQIKLGDMRQDFFRKVVRSASDTNRAFLLNNVVVPRAIDVMNKNYHPAARINACLILGLLDAQEGISGQRPPRPLLPALAEILKVVDNPESPEYLVAASLTGIQRHAEIDGQLPANARMRADVRGMIVDSMLRLLAKYDALQTEDQAGYVLSRRAVQTLDSLSLLANEPKLAEVKAAMWKLARKLDAGKWLRLDAMVGLSRLPLDQPTQYLEALGQLVAYVTKTERSRVLAAQKQVAIDEAIKAKTGMAQAKRAVTGSGPRRGPDVAGSGESATIRDDGPRGGGEGMMGGVMGGMAGMEDFDENGLFPYHLYYARANVKVSVATARNILGTASRTPTGLKATLANDAEAQRLITLLEKELKELLVASDIGYVEEKPLTEAERSAMARINRDALDLRDQSNSVRVLAGFGNGVNALEKLVGKVELTAQDKETEELATAPINVAPRPAADGEVQGEADAAGQGEQGQADAGQGGEGQGEQGGEGQGEQGEQGGEGQGGENGGGNR